MIPDEICSVSVKFLIQRKTLITNADCCVLGRADEVEMKVTVRSGGPSLESSEEPRKNGGKLVKLSVYPPLEDALEGVLV